MILLAGWGKKSKKVADAGLMMCANCNNMAIFEIRELANTASLFFVPVAKWNKQSYLVCSVCEAGFELSEDKLKEALQEAVTIPASATINEIWDKLAEIFISFMKQGKDLNEWPEFAKESLHQTYKKDDVNYVLARYNEDLARTMEKINKK